MSFAGKTVADRTTAMKMIEAHQKQAAREGEPAPDFTLPLVGGDGTLTLSEMYKKRPVALVFGSYT